jgi:hypothetical protein
MGERAHGFRSHGKRLGRPVVIITDCTTPRQFIFLLSEGRGSIRAVRAVPVYGRYKYTGKLLKPGGKHKPDIANRLLR